MAANMAWMLMDATLSNPLQLCIRENIHVRQMQQPSLMNFWSAMHTHLSGVEWWEKLPNLRCDNLHPHSGMPDHKECWSYIPMLLECFLEVSLLSIRNASSRSNSYMLIAAAMKCLHLCGGMARITQVVTSKLWIILVGRVLHYYTEVAAANLNIVQCLCGVEVAIHSLNLHKHVNNYLSKKFKLATCNIFRKGAQINYNFILWYSGKIYTITRPRFCLSLVLYVTCCPRKWDMLLHTYIYEKGNVLWAYYGYGDGCTSTTGTAYRNYDYECTMATAMGVSWLQLRTYYEHAAGCKPTSGCYSCNHKMKILRLMEEWPLMWDMAK